LLLRLLLRLEEFHKISGRLRRVIDANPSNDVSHVYTNRAENDVRKTEQKICFANVLPPPIEEFGLRQSHLMHVMSSEVQDISGYNGMQHQKRNQRFLDFARNDRRFMGAA
jgi:hypothetical protein